MPVSGGDALNAATAIHWGFLTQGMGTTSQAGGTSHYFPESGQRIADGNGSVFDSETDFQRYLKVGHLPFDHMPSGQPTTSDHEM